MSVLAVELLSVFMFGGMTDCLLSWWREQLTPLTLHSHDCDRVALKSICGRDMMLCHASLCWATASRLVTHQFSTHEATNRSNKSLEIIELFRWHSVLSRPILGITNILPRMGNRNVWLLWMTHVFDLRCWYSIQLTNVTQHTHREREKKPKLRRFLFVSCEC